jgi:tetratricopeptide (TPR) repeat protein
MTQLFTKTFKRLTLKKEKKTSQVPVVKSQHAFNSGSSNSTKNNKSRNPYKSPFEMPIDVAIDDTPIVNFNGSKSPLHHTPPEEHDYSVDETHSNDISFMETSNSRDSSTRSSNSTMSFGSSKEQDSFAFVSHTGLSDDDESFNSRYLDEPRRNEQNPRDIHDSNIINSSESNDAISAQMDMRAATTTSNLPRLTIQTKQTKALLATPTATATSAVATPTNAKRQPLNSPNTVVTQLETPSSAVNTSDEFPLPTQESLNNTPEIHIPSNLPTQLQTSTSQSQSFSMSFSLQEMPSFDTSFLKEKQMSRESKLMQAAYRELEYWDEQLKDIIDLSGHASVQSAQGMMDLGASLLRCRKYPEALTVYKNAVVIWRIRHGEHSLIVAKGLDKIGLAASLCSTKDNLDWAYLALKEALQIRMTYLGPHHCDCVDTLNNIAGVFLQRKELASARDIYLDVLNLRASIFGNYHASIAITAQTLGKIFFQLRDFDNALLHYELSLRIYKSGEMNLKRDHPLVMKVKKHVDLTHRMMIADEKGNITADKGRHK